MEVTKELVFRSLSLAGLVAEMEGENTGRWKQCLQKLAHQPVSFQSSFKKYQQAYHQAHGGGWIDISLILMFENRPLGLWPLSIHCHGGRYLLTSHGLPMWAPVFAGGEEKAIVKKLVVKCLNFLEIMGTELNIKEVQSREAFAGETVLSEWHRQSLLRGGRPSLEYDLYLDLSPGWENVRAKFRDSYKPLINSGLRTWKTEVFGSGLEKSAWEEFRSLHREAAGRKTRADSTWEIQFQAVKGDDSFVVFLRDENNRMVGGGLFDLSATEGNYSVGAYDRSLFKKPLGHVVQALAIKEMIRRNIKWYRIGTRPFSGNSPGSFSKERSIAYFKEGFSSHLVPVYLMSHPIPSPVPT